MEVPARESPSLAKEVMPASPHRVIAFARFFKNYMGVSSIVAAALPIPVTSFDLITVPTGMSKTLSVYTSLFCFLTLGMIFFSRHTLASFMFPALSPKRSLILTVYVGPFTHPLLYMIGSFVCVFYYHSRVGWGVAGDVVRVSQGDATIQAAFFIGIFVFAEASFILMAIKEYLQDLLRLSDLDLIKGASGGASAG